MSVLFKKRSLFRAWILPHLARFYLKAVKGGFSAVGPEAESVIRSFLREAENG